MLGFLEAARQKPDIQVLKRGDDDDGHSDTAGGYETVTIGDQRGYSCNLVLEDKKVACSMLACFIEELAHGFSNDYNGVPQLTFLLLKIFYHFECQTPAAKYLPDLVHCLLESEMELQRTQAYPPKSFPSLIRFDLLTPQLPKI